MDKWGQPFPKRQEEHWSKSNCGRKQKLVSTVLSFTFIWWETILIYVSLSSVNHLLHLCFKYHFTFSQCCSPAGFFFAFLLHCQSVTLLYKNTEVMSTKFFIDTWAITWREQGNVVRYLQNRSCCGSWVNVYLTPLLSFLCNHFQYPHFSGGYRGHPAGWTGGTKRLAIPQAFYSVDIFVMW